MVSDFVPDAGGAAPRETPMTPTRTADTAPTHWWGFPPLRNALLAAALAAAAWALARWGAVGRGVEISLFATAMLLGGWHWTREALQTLLDERAIGIEFLMLAAALGSILLGLWDEAAALVVLFALAEGVEEYTHERTRSAVRALLDLVPQEVSLVVETGEERRPAASIAVGDRVRVRPGERVAIDGRIVDGLSSLNQAPVTGESIPVPKRPGDEVFAGSINGEGLLLVEATRPFADNSIARIIHLVEQAQEEKGRAQQWIERFGRRYTPAVFIAAAVLFLVPWSLGLPAEVWAHKAIVLLVAAAPCALVMSTPIAMATGIWRASRRGILVKGGVHLEHLAGIRCVAFDKTGTLTKGVPQLVAFEVMEGAEETALAIAAGLEQGSRHPLAVAVAAAAESRGIRPFAARNSTSMTGHGVRGVVGETEWFIVRPAWLAARTVVPKAIAARVAELQSAGRTVAVLGTGTTVVAILAFADEARPEASEALEELRRLGITTVLLSGDHPETAQAIARELGIDDARGDLRPEDKVTAVRTLEKERGAVLMVGDGINDAPALAAATCGAAMGAAGSDAAIEAADVALLSDDLRNIPTALRVARSVRRISHQNIVLSIAVLLVMIPAAVLGLIGVTAAVLVHETAEVLAVLNGLRAGAVNGRG